jgi:hypothetical protein
LEPSEFGDFFHLARIEAEYTQWIKKLISFSGMKTKRATLKSMMQCGVDVEGGKITIRPSKHERLEGWGGLPEELYVIVPTSAAPAELGAAVRLALSRCE